MSVQADEHAEARGERAAAELQRPGLVSVQADEHVEARGEQAAAELQRPGLVSVRPTSTRRLGESGQLQRAWKHCALLTPCPAPLLLAIPESHPFTLDQSSSDSERLWHFSQPQGEGC